MTFSLPVKLFALAVLLLSLTVCYYSTSTPLTELQYNTHLHNKVVLLCGASSGIGESLAYQLAGKHARLVLVARSKDKLRRVKERALEKGAARVEVILYDFSNVTGTKEVVDRTVQLFGGIDYLVLNHGAMPSGLFLAETNQPAFIERVFNINIMSFIQLTVHSLPHLEQTSGHIFVTSSLFGFTPTLYAALYSSTKHAINGFYYSLQQELLAKQSAVSVTVGELGFIVTDDLKVLLGKALDALPGSGKGDLKECTAGMRDSLITRPRTFSYPWISNHVFQLMWAFNPWYHEVFVKSSPFGTTYEEMVEAHAELNHRKRNLGSQKGNLY